MSHENKLSALCSSSKFRIWPASLICPQCIAQETKFACSQASAGPEDNRNRVEFEKAVGYIKVSRIEEDEMYHIRILFSDKANSYSKLL
jgi:hypothetical protein